MPAEENPEIIHYTVDVVLLCEPDKGVVAVRDVLLVQRRRSPYNEWSLPGGYIHRGEAARRAAARKLSEETGITVPESKLSLISVYDNPHRDSRGRHVSVAFVSIVERMQLTAGDNIERAQWWPTTSVPATLALDHHEILTAAQYRL